MLIVGIDPGTTGSLAAIDNEGPELIACLDMPVINLGTKTRKFIDSLIVGEWFAELPEVPKMVVIEHQQSMRGDFINTAFMQGVMFGAITSAIIALGLPIHFATPAAWKRKAGLLKMDKKASLARGRQLFGNHPDLKRQKDETRAEAALIAFYGPPERALSGKRASAPKFDLLGDAL